jgi:hypothetical protein
MEDWFGTKELPRSIAVVACISISSLHSDETKRQRSHYRIKAGLNTEFGEYILGMGLDRFRCYAQPLRHPLVRVTPADELQNDVLTRAETPAIWKCNDIVARHRNPFPTSAISKHLIMDRRYYTCVAHKRTRGILGSR